MVYSGLAESGENRFDVGISVDFGVLFNDDCLNVRFTGVHICVPGLIGGQAVNRNGSSEIDRFGKGVTDPDSKQEIRWLRIALWS